MLLEFAKIRMFRYFCNRSKGLKMAYNLNLGGRLLSLSEPKVMGIVNLTPDSFFAQSRYQDTCQVVRKVASMLEDGMDILDLGAVSSRPGATFPSPEEEWQRLEKPLKALVREFPSLVISIDTFRSEIALRCADEGALVINDISAGAFDPGMFPAVARLQAHDWPGNVRELRNVLEFSACLTPSGIISRDRLPSHLAQPQVDEALTLAQRTHIFEKREIRRLLAVNGSDLPGKKKTAAQLGISLASLYNKLAYPTGD